MPGGSMSHPAVRHPHESLNNRLGDHISAWFGSMRTFWVLVLWQLGWMTLAELNAPLLRKDPYPFVFLLFLSNLIQLWALPVLGNTQNRADQKRNLKADADHRALTYLASGNDRHAALLVAVAEHLGVALPAAPPVEEPAP
jgi:uncharacterized membrane protein